MASDLQELKHYVLNASVVLEGIAKGRKITLEEKKALIIKRCEKLICDMKMLGKENETNP